MKKITLATTLTLWPIYGFAAVEFSGSLGLQQNYFLENPKFSGQKHNDSTEIVTEPEATWRGNKHSFSFKAFGRAGSEDDERNHLDVRELHWSYDNAFVDLNAGVNIVYWGVTESWHLVNIINQVDLVESIYQDEKLGQPMVNATFIRDWGNLSFYWLPVFRERVYPAVEGRYRTSPPVDNNNARYLRTDKSANQDYAIRYSHYIGNIDLGIHWFEGIGREPVLGINDVGNYLIPTYAKIRQVGIDLQLTTDAWLWKLEAIANHNLYEDYTAAVGGFEYTFFQAFDTDADIGWLLEYIHDERGESGSVFSRDVFLGTRISLNDLQDATMLLGAIVDKETRETVVKMEISRRIGKQFTLEVEGSLFSRARHALQAYEQDSMLSLRFDWHF
ncbi:hypothetical protein ACSV5M_00385 [Cellvibrio sp. ARAG 10.3]|uniref:hypothetical protein n=1 Tax=Cellvibrio sp. ARAG 10.3 TaxID=3451358 RepID=UPI003F458BB0